MNIAFAFLCYKTPWAEGRRGRKGGAGEKNTKTHKKQAEKRQGGRAKGRNTLTLRGKGMGDGREGMGGWGGMRGMRGGQ